jgi:asparagine synthase (glutamine-hydrolysing)
MPGLHLVCDFDGNLEHKEGQLLQALRATVHSGSYVSESIKHEKSCFIGLSRYEGYPFTTIQTDRYTIYIDGKIYGQDPSVLRKELGELADGLFRKGNDVRRLLSGWLLDTDGDFVIAILDKTSGRIIIFDDILGRLPLYYYLESHGICLSREIRFINHWTGHAHLDRMAIAQYLLFGFPLGDLTLFENVRRLPPATMIDIDLRESEARIDTVYTFNYDAKAHKGQGIQETAHDLHELFLTATNSRAASTGKNVVGLSGGLDSRAVAAALHELKIPFSGVTYLDFDQKANHDARVAEQLAGLFGIDWELFNLDPPAERDARELLEIKSGMNPLGMSYILPFFKSVQARFGHDINYFTGDGGILFKDHFPDTRISDLGGLTGYIIKKHARFPVAAAAALTRMERERITAALEARLATYPEKDWQNKYMHFLYLDRCFKLQFEGEDRNRFYFWSVTPFYATAFFTYAVNCPDDMKKSLKLYQEFFRCLSPDAIAIDYANLQIPITSGGGLFLYDRVYPRLPSALKGVIRKAMKRRNIRSPVAPDRLAGLVAQINRCRRVDDYLSVSELRRLENLNQYNYEILHTIISVIEQSESST